MAVKNQIQEATATTEVKKSQTIEYSIGDKQIKLTPSIVKNYLVSGDKNNVTDQEIVMFVNLCKYAKLNPWMKEAYCIKYGTNPATMVVGKEAFTKRAEKHPAFDGDESGIIVMTKEGEIRYREGTFKLSDEELVGAYAEVFRRDRSHSKRVEISLGEYIGRKKDGSANEQWTKRPATMLRKVALVQALRESFPDYLGGMFVAEEQGFSETETAVEVPSEQPLIENTAASKTPAIEEKKSEVKAQEEPDSIPISEAFFDDNE